MVNHVSIIKAGEDKAFLKTLSQRSRERAAMEVQSVERIVYDVGVMITPSLRASETYGNAWPSIVTFKRVVWSSLVV